MEMFLAPTSGPTDPITGAALIMREYWPNELRKYDTALTKKGAITYGGMGWLMLFKPICVLV